MNLGRIFASAFARRLAYVAVAAVLAWCGVGEVRAQAGTCGPAPVACDKGQAYARAMQMATENGYCGGNPITGQNVIPNPASPTTSWQARHTCDDAAQRVAGHTYYWGCPVESPWVEESKTCGNDCESKPTLGNTAWSNVNSADRMCKDSCVYEGGAGELPGVCLDAVIDAQRYRQCTSWAPTGDACSASSSGSGFPGDASEAPSDSDGDGTSDGNDGSPNNPGQGGQGGSGLPGQDGGGLCGGDGQPTCGSPGAGSGNGNTSGGGGDCDTPPSSAGDAILAQIAFQTWATRCALKGNANAGAGSGDGAGEQPGWTKGDGPAVPDDDTDYVGESTRWGLGISTDLLDQENIFGGGACPAVSGVIYGHSWSTADIPQWCTIVQIMRAVVLLVGAWTALNILLGRSGV